MQRHRIILMCLIGIAEATLLGCSRKTVVQPVVVPQTQTPIIVQSETMPAPRVENPGPPPDADNVWVSGHWEKTDRGWVWKEGHWERRSN